MRTHAIRLLKTVALGCAIYSMGGFILVYLVSEGEL